MRDPARDPDISTQRADPKADADHGEAPERPPPFCDGKPARKQPSLAIHATTTPILPSRPTTSITRGAQTATRSCLKPHRRSSWQAPQIPNPPAAACQHHCRHFFDESQPATPTETQLTQELADTAWRLNRITLPEATAMSTASSLDRAAS